MASSQIWLVALAAGGATFFAVTWLAAVRQDRNLPELEKRRRQIEAAFNPKMTVRQRVRSRLALYGWYASPVPVLVGLTFTYLLAVVALTTIGVGGWVGLVIGLPASVAVTAGVANSTAGRRRESFQRQLVQAIDLMAGQLKGGLSPAMALERVVSGLPDPLRSELDGALAAHRAAKPLSDAIEVLAVKYPSKAMSMLVAALRIDEERGGKMSAALETAADTVRKDFELSSEAAAELAQEKMQFYGIVGIVSAIALYLFAGSSAENRAALTSPTGVTMLSFAAANFTFGILRVLRMLNKAKGQT